MSQQVKNRPKKQTKKKAPQRKFKQQTPPNNRPPVSITLQELERRWASLHISPLTINRLKGLFEQEEGPVLALAATTALALEQEQEHKVTESLADWAMEQLRLTFLEEGSSHLVESGRFLLDTLLAWNLSLNSGWLTRSTLPLIVLVGLLLCGLLLGLILYAHQRRRTS